GEGGEGLDWWAGAGEVERESWGGGVDHTGTKRIREPQRLHAVLALAAHLDHGELALDVRAGHRHVDHAMHRHEAIELVLDLLDHHGRTARDDGDARDVPLVLCVGAG